VIRSQSCGNNFRPSVRERDSRLKLASKLLTENKWRPANPQKLLANWEELESVFGVDVALTEDQHVILESVLSEVRASNYAGSAPPEKSYERSTVGQELFEFRWNSITFQGSLMYFKFSISPAGGDQRLYVHSLHPNRERRQ
jgi:hypothetical protein